MCFDNAFRDVKTKTGALTHSGCFQAHVGAEELFHSRWWNTHSLVVDTNMGNIAWRLDANGDGSIRVGIFDGVIEQVAQGLLQATTIPVANNRSSGYLESNSVMWGKRAQLFHHLFCQLSYITSLA